MNAIRLSVFSTTLALSIGLESCKSANPNQNLQNSEIKSIGSPLELCVGLRGNGHYLSTHFGGLARIVENYGIVDALAGGSSSSITMFLYEAMMQNPAIQTAADDQKPFILSAMLKSVIGYLASLKESPEAKSIVLAIEIAKDPKIAQALAIPKDRWREAAASLLKIFSDPKYRSLINQNVLDMLADKDSLGYISYEYKVKEVLEMVKGFGKFHAVDQKVLFREGLLSFSAVARTIGNVGEFYAGRTELSTKASLATFLRECGTDNATTGKTWKELASTQTTSGKTCGAIFHDAATAFHKEFDPQRVNPKTLKINSTIGRTIPSLVTTSVIMGDSGLREFRAANKRYLSGEAPNLNLDFDAVNFGYWLPAAYAARVQAEIKNFNDGKSKKFVSLGTTHSWMEAIERSPAEPGLSRYVPISEQQISVGGWSDLQPVQVLKAAGCQKVVYLTRRSEESNFLVGNTPIDGTRPAQGLSELLGMKETGRREIFDLNNQNSGFSVALQKADAVWCTDWNRFTDLQTVEMMDESYNSEIVSKDLFFASSSKRTNNIASNSIVGCSP